MSSFIKKIYICLFEPRKLGLFFSERIIKSVLQLLLFALIAISPYIISLAVDNNISDSSRNYIEEKIMYDAKLTENKIINGKFDGESSTPFLINEAIVYFNPKNETFGLPLEYATYHVIELREDMIVVSFLNNEIYKKSYVELGYDNIDFKKIIDADYLELDRLISLINVAFASFHTEWTIINSAIILFDVFLTMLLSALILSFIVRIVNPIVGFKIRFKGALDAQFISLVFILIMLLFKEEFFRYVGITLSAIYLFIAMISIIRIEIKKRMFSDKEGD